MEEFITFFGTYGWQISIIALVGIILLEVLKELKVFDKLEEKYRHLCYLGTSVGFSVIATMIYLAIIGQFDIVYICTCASAMYALNQVIYTTLSNLSVIELVEKLLTFIKALIAKKKEEEETAEEITVTVEGTDNYDVGEITVVEETDTYTTTVYTTGEQVVIDMSGEVLPDEVVINDSVTDEIEVKEEGIDNDSFTDDLDETEAVTDEKE